MTTTSVERGEASSASRLIVHGVIAGLVGGVVFGMMMAVMGMLPMVGMLVGQESAVVGFIVHLGISAFIGAVYALVIGRFPNTTTVAAVGGVVNGIVWWVLGALVMMPLFLGMSEMVFVVGETQWWSLMGHIIYGLVTAFVFLALRRRSE
jgi:uncharacterized membrane protein YagU involved in acid resistance